MSEEENERDFMKACFNVVAGLEVKNENQAIAKEAILDEVKNLTKENNHLKEVIKEVRKHCNQEIKSASIQYERDKKFMYQQYIVYHERVLQILDKVKGEDND